MDETVLASRLQYTQPIGLVSWTSDFAVCNCKENHTDVQKVKNW